jgi:hypothetical protein
MFGEVAEVGCVECQQRYLIAQAAGGDPSIVLCSGPSPELGFTSQFTPYPGYLAVIGDHGPPGRPGIQAATPVLAPLADHRPLRQLPHGDEGQPDPGSGSISDRLGGTAAPSGSTRPAPPTSRRSLSERPTAPGALRRRFPAPAPSTRPGSPRPARCRVPRRATAAPAGSTTTAPGSSLCRQPDQRHLGNRQGGPGHRGPEQGRPRRGRFGVVRCAGQVQRRRDLRGQLPSPTGVRCRRDLRPPSATASCPAKEWAGYLSPGAPQRAERPSVVRQQPAAARRNGSNQLADQRQQRTRSRHSN